MAWPTRRERARGVPDQRCDGSFASAGTKTFQPARAVGISHLLSRLVLLLGALVTWWHPWRCWISKVSSKQMLHSACKWGFL